MFYDYFYFTIIIIFYFKKLKDKDIEKSKEISQLILDDFINDLDQHFREQGIGDMSIGKYVKNYVKKFYFRLKILDKALKENSDININDYLRKFGILDYGNENQIIEDFTNLYNAIVVDK